MKNLGAYLAVAIVAVALSVVLTRYRSDADSVQETENVQNTPPSNEHDHEFENALRSYYSAFQRKSADDILRSLEDLADFSLSFDAADMMASAGVYDFLTEHLNQCMTSELSSSCCSPNIQAQIALTLGSAAQNHPVVSKRLADTGAVSVLTKLVESGPHDCAHRSLHALLSIFRSYSPAGLTFANELNGIAVLRPILSSHPQRTLRIVETLAMIDADIPTDWCSKIAEAISSCPEDSRPDVLAALLTNKQCASHAAFNETLLKPLSEDAAELSVYLQQAAHNSTTPML